MHRNLPISDVQIDAARLLRPTGDELRRWASARRIFVSSVMDLRDERRAAIDGIGDNGAEAVAWELITPRPVAPEDAWLDGVATSDSIVLLLGTGYGRRRATGFSATHAEFNRAEELGLDRWVFVDARVDPSTREGYLQTWMAELGERYSYATFRDGAELRAAVARAIADLARYRLYTWHKVGNLVIRADEANLIAPSAGWTADRGSLETTGRISDPTIRAALAEIHAQGRPVPLVVHGQLFEATLGELEERAERGDHGYRAAYRLNPARTSDSLLGMTMSEGGREWRPEDLVGLTVRELAGLEAPERPRMMTPHTAIDWPGLVTRAGRIPELVEVLAELVLGEALLASGALSRVTRIEARLVGPPPGLIVRVEGSVALGQGLASRPVAVSGQVAL